MTTRRSIGFLGLLLVMGGLTLTLPGCGGGGPAGETLPTGELKLTPSTNAKGEVIGTAQDEYKTAQPPVAK